jgi:hypothetical protein
MGNRKQPQFLRHLRNLYFITNQPDLWKQLHRNLLYENWSIKM